MKRFQSNEIDMKEKEIGCTKDAGKQRVVNWTDAFVSKPFLALHSFGRSHVLLVE